MLLQSPSQLKIASSYHAAIRRNLPITPLQAHAPDDRIATLEGDFSALDVKGFWGQSPLVIRKAFKADELLGSKTWPDWQDIVDLACTERKDENDWKETDDHYYGDNNDPDAWEFDGDDSLWSTGESARLIKHIPGKIDSFKADLGPFSYQDLKEISENEKWSLLMNDVDRYRPSLADWMDENFGFLPRWRRDDAQISIAPTGGGIGPHVDSYDVFLIQAAGTREWRIQPTPTVSVQEEMDRLLPGISVRILETSKESDDFASVCLEPGDLLYLPPRVVHWGVSTSDDCMTLSVGCRAPAAQELVARLAEDIFSSFHPAASQRYTEKVLPSAQQAYPSITPAVRARMKDMVLQAVENSLQDESAWDALIGKLVTEPKRLSEIATAEDRGDEYMVAWGSTPRQVLLRVKSHPRAFLKRVSGVSFATSRIDSAGGDIVDRLYAHGQMWEVVNDKCASNIFRCIERGAVLTSKQVDCDLSLELEDILLDLLAEGVLVPSAYNQDGSTSHIFGDYTSD